MAGEQESEGRLERGLQFLGRLAHRRAGTIVLALLLSLVPTGWLASQLVVRSSFLDLLPEEEEPVRQLRTVMGHVRATSDVVIAVRTTDRPEAERFATALLTALASHPHIAGVGGHIDLEWFHDRELLFAEESELERLRDRARDTIDAETMRATGLFIDLGEDTTDEDTTALLADVDEAEQRLGREEWIVTTDGDYLCLWAFFTTPSGDLTAARAAWTDVQRTVDTVRASGGFSDEIEVRYAGGLPTQVEGERALREDLSVAGALGFLAVVLLIGFALRTPRALALLSLPLLTGLAWTFAFAQVAVGHLNIISGFLFSILSGLGIEYGIHLLHRFRELREEGLALEPAIERLVPSTGRALVSGALTNAGVFAVIALAQFRGFSEFGLIAAVGLLLTLVVTVLGLPALLVLTERYRPMRFPPRSLDAVPDAGIVVPSAVRWGIVLAVPAMALGSLAVLLTGGARFDGNWRLLAGDTEVSRFGEYLRHHLGGTREAGALWLRDDAQQAALRALVEGVGAAREARGEAWDVVEIHTLDEVFPSPEHQAARAALAVEIGEQLARIRPSTLSEADRERLESAQRVVAHAQPFTVDELPYSVVGYLLTSDDQGSIVHLSAPDTDDTGTAVLTSWAAQARELSAAIDAAGLDAPMLSENWVAGEIFERIARDGRFLFFGTLVAVFLVLLLDFRRFGAALAVLGSVSLGVVSIAGAMWLSGLTLNFMNAAILPVCVAISLDNAIHVYHRWREGGPGSIPIVLRQTTVANALSSSTNLLGFGALVLTHHAGLRSVAYLAGSGVLLTYVSTTVWFPMVLWTLDARRAGAPQAPKD